MKSVVVVVVCVAVLIAGEQFLSTIAQVEIRLQFWGIITQLAAKSINNCCKMPGRRSQREQRGRQQSMAVNSQLVSLAKHCSYFGSQGTSDTCVSRSMHAAACRPFSTAWGKNAEKPNCTWIDTLNNTLLHNSGPLLAGDACSAPLNQSSLVALHCTVVWNEKFPNAAANLKQVVLNSIIQDIRKP